MPEGAGADDRAGDRGGGDDRARQESIVRDVDGDGDAAEGGEKTDADAAHADEDRLIETLRR